MATENSLEYIYEAMNLELPSKEVDINAYSDAGSLIEHQASDRIGAALRVFIRSIVDSSNSIEKIDRSAIEAQVAFIDKLISAQLDEIMHSEPYQKLEAQWKQLKFLVDRTNFKKNVKIEILNCSKQDLQEDFEDSPEIIQSALYKHVYVDEYDTPGGEPYGALISSYEFDSGAQDVGLLTDLSHVSAAAHCPFIGSVGSKFFGKPDVHELPKIDDLANYMDRAEYIKWRGFRDSEDSRYVGLVLPRFLLRLPYDPENNPVSDFNYSESVTGAEHEKYLWGNASFAFAANMVRSFVDNGWCVQIRGPESGGKVEDLPIHNFDVGKGTQMKIPTEILIPETREFEFANQGFIPFSYYKNRSYGCFFSANSVRRPEEYDDPTVTANERINARLPYIFLTARLAHYLKVLQRENIGATKSAAILEQELNNWIKGLVTEMKNPGPELAATHPLSYGKVTVTENPDNPGFFRVALAVMPHFQVEGIDVSLSLVSKMPQGK
ncbi:MAG TPA: type VI secretion system contractile sheath large subunit [Fibrobacteria bacterium]|nr:type VI secretion system contractile sheath large subunit [Fibrobacteria bacterium]HOX50524.1 type VI secretion system contractile sheath large subunit [Fibrobacteria bacterium]